jgi:hypothetical protein
MNRLLQHFRLGTFAGAFLASSLLQAQGELKIFTAIEVEFATERGKSYQLQGSADLAAWNNIGDPVFGNGNTVNQIFSAKGGGTVTFGNYRLDITEITVPGLAPWSFQGLSLGLGDDGAHEHYDFLSETNGVKVSPTGTDPFTYTFTRTGDNEAQVNLVKGSSAGDKARRDLYTFTFTAAKLGAFVREEFRGTRLKDRDLGTFTVLDGTQPPGGGTGGNPGDTNSVPVAPPASLKGLAYSFLSGATPERLEFLSETTGIEIEDKARSDDDDDDEPNKPFSYTYAFTTPTNATLVVSLPNNRRDEYALTFTQGAQGTFVRREFRGDLLTDTDTGAFSPAGNLTNGGNNGGNNGGGVTPPDGNGTPVTELTGTQYLFRSGDTPDLLVFTTATRGSEQSTEDDDDANDFTYAYTVKAGSAAALVVTFKPGKRDEYDLTFNTDGTGTFVRREVRDDVVTDTDSGSFVRETGN